LAVPAYCGYTLYILNRYRAPETTLKPDLHLPPACTHFASLHQQQKFTLQYIYGNTNLHVYDLTSVLLYPFTM
jgi:hypothetical protein